MERERDEEKDRDGKFFFKYFLIFLFLDRIVPTAMGGRSWVGE